MTNPIRLFVYGTLRPRAGGQMGAEPRARLAREGVYEGPAKIAGRLADLGDYPGLLDGDGWVQGDLYVLPDSDRTLGWLDDYEGITGASTDEYRRCERLLIAGRGENITAWVYVWVLPLKAGSIVASGDWLIR
jgi:gamma-glutamylcyclotransferase (GGCT)/AIG2-like uncharacterized protein YtfP